MPLERSLVLLGRLFPRWCVVKAGRLAIARFMRRVFKLDVDLSRYMNITVVFGFINSSLPLLDFIFYYIT
jgi:hypothetical protein